MCVHLGPGFRKGWSSPVTLMKQPDPKCPKCDHPTFSARAIEPGGSRFKMIAICCSSCGAVVGIQPFSNTEELIRELAAHLGFTLK